MDQRYLRELHQLKERSQNSAFIQIQPVFVYPEVPLRLASLVRHHDCVRVIRVDDDDALAENFLDLIPNREGLHTLPLGFEADLLRRELRPTRRPCLSLNTVFHGRSDLVEKFAQVGHHVMREWAENNDITYNEIETSHKAYIYSRHRQSDSNFAAVRKSIAEDPRKKVFSGALRNRFGLSETAYLEWRQFTRNAPSTGIRKTWTMNAELGAKAGTTINELKSLNTRMRSNTKNIF